MPFEVKKPILACGADLKGAFALAKGKKAYLIEGFGDLAELNNFERYESAVKRLERELNIRPKVVACDLHPGYFSSRFAENLDIRPCKVQHHEAHVASAIIDDSIRGQVIGVAFDGTGFGPDGNIWGGEFFVGDLKDFKRVGHLCYMPMPGGEVVIKEPWRMAASYLYMVFGKKFLDLKIEFMKKLDKERLQVLTRMVDKKINSPLTSSAGRLFDAVASLVLSKGTSASEAELPIELERIADRLCLDRYDFDIRKDREISIVDVSKMIKGIVGDLSRKIDKTVLSGKFHNTVADMILKMSLRLKRRFEIKKVVLSGGVFQNNLLTAKASELLKWNDFKVYTQSRIKTNDAGIPMGQIAIANVRPRCA